MATRYFALILGVIYTIVGVLGFFPAMRTPHEMGDPALALNGSYGYLWGLFPVNWVHNLVHLAIGIWGIVAYFNFPQARTFARSIAIIFGILAILGLFPVLNTLFGLTPLFSHDIWLHALTSIVAIYFGWAPAREPVYERRVRGI